MKNHIRTICLIFTVMLAVPNFSIALTETSCSMDNLTDTTEQTVAESVIDIPETTDKAADVAYESEKIKLPPAEKTLHEPIEGPESPETVLEVSPYDIELIACIIYQEAGGDSSCDECRRMVADVVLNRVADPRFPDTIFDVLTEPGQYGFNPRTGIVWPERANDIYEQHAVERAYRIAEEVLSGKHSELYGEGYIWQASFRQGSESIWCCSACFGK